jgi:SPP1 family predicted phage head-tail adaptor
MTPSQSRVRIGSLRHRVTVEAMTRVATGSYNETKPTWTPVATRWASVTPASPTDQDFGPQNQARCTHIVLMRYYAGITAEHRITYLGRHFNIVGIPVDVEERHIWHSVKCQEVAGA